MLTLIGGFGIALMFTYLGFAGFIRREVDIPQQFAWAMPWLLFFAIAVGFGQIIFAYNLFHSIKRKKRTIEEIQYELIIQGRQEGESEQEKITALDREIPDRPDTLQSSLGNGPNYHGYKLLHYVGVATTALVGILHLILVPFFIGFNSTSSIFFVVTGLAQLFWTLPLIKLWGNFWYFIGITGTVVLISLYLSVSFDWKFVIFYLVIGLAQLFWTLPLIKRWGNFWYFIGITGMVVLILAWNITNAPLSIKGL